MVTASTQFPEEHASLSDGTTTVKFIFTDGKGRKNDLAFKALPYPRTALKTTSGESKYSDLEPPYFAIAQDDFTGGRGNEDFEGDTSRYSDGQNVDTNKESGVVLTGRETYSTGYRNADFHLPGSLTWQGVYSTTRYIAVSFVASASYTSYQCAVWIRKIGSPGNIQVELWSNSSSSPGAMLASKTTTAANVTTDVLSVLLNSVWTGTPGLTADTTYWVVIDGGDADATDHWEIGVDAAAAGKKSSDASSWSATTYSPYYRITPQTTGFTAKFFEYKRGLYMVTQPNDTSNSALYINGDRGTADDNTADKTKLNDATKSWTASEWVGDIVLITNGPGSEEKQNWRTITANGTNYLTTATWDTVHTTATEYVILGSDKWTSVVADLGDFCTDVAVSGGNMYFALGESTAVKRYNFRTFSGAWGSDTGSEQCEASTLLGIRHSDRGDVLYGALNSHELFQKGIWNGNVPLVTDTTAGDIYSDLGTLVPTNTPWDARSFTNVTQKLNNGITRIDVAAGFTTGMLAVENLEAPLDITAADRIVFMIKPSITITSAGDLEFVYDDVEDLGKECSPEKVFLADYGYNRQPTKVYHLDEEGGSPTYTDLVETYDGIAANFETVTIEADDRLLIGYSIPFNKAYFDVGTVNDVVATATASYFNGKLSLAMTTADGTETGGDTSLGQDGTISWTLPENWVAQTINSVEAYWIHLTWNATLKAGVTIKRIYVTVDEKASMVPLYDDLTNLYDGTTYASELMKLGTEDYIYIGNGTKFNEITVDVGTANDIASVMTASYFDGAGWTAVTISDGTDVSGDTLKQDGDITFTIPWNWEPNTVNGTEAYWIRLEVSVALSTDFSINKITVTKENNSNNDMQALTLGEWAQVEITPSGGFTAFPIPDASSVKSVGINSTTNFGAYTLDIKDVKLVQSNVDWLQASLPASHRINGMEAYSGNVDDPIENPWVFTEAGVYELQTQNDDQVVAIPLRELASLQSSENGIGHTVNGTYLYFNIGEKIQRYFNRTLDDVGPDRDEGLPAARQGIPSSMTSYPGRIYAGIDANTGTSSALTLRGTAWSEVYRAPKTTARIRSVHVQAIPGTNVDKLWISKGADVLSVPISLNPYNDADFRYMHEGYLTTSWIYANMKDVVKLWKSLKIFAEDVDSNRYIVADYQTDTSSTWTEIGTFDTAPVEEIDIATTLPQAKRIRYRLRFYTNDSSESPRMKAIVTEGVAFVPVKYQYSWTFAVTQDTDNINLFGVYDNTLTADEQFDKLVSWANSGNPLTLRHKSDLYDNKKVFIDPISIQPIREVSHEGVEYHVAQLTCIQV